MKFTYNKPSFMSATLRSYNIHFKQHLQYSTSHTTRNHYRFTNTNPTFGSTPQYRQHGEWETATEYETSVARTPTFTSFPVCGAGVLISLSGFPSAKTLPRSVHEALKHRSLTRLVSTSS